MAAIGQYRTRASALAGQQGVRVGSRAVRLVASFLTVEVHGRIRDFARASSRWLLVVIGAAEALVSRPCLQQGSIYGEVLIRKQVTPTCLLEYSSEESVGNISCEEPLTVLREHRRIPNRIIHIQAYKPTKQQVVIQLFHQHALTAYGVKHLQQQRTQQLFRRYRRPPCVRVQLAEPSSQLA